MLYSKRFINPELATYIREHTNKSLEKYLNSNEVDKLGQYTSLQIDHASCKWYIVLPFVSLLSFLAGYKMTYIKSIS